MKKIFVILMIAVACFGLSAQKAKKESVTIQTNGICETCKKCFETNVPFFKGVEDMSYDIKTSQIKIIYNPSKTNPEVLRKNIGKLGYDADNVKADSAARAKLPACCRMSKDQHGTNSDRDAAKKTSSSCGEQKTEQSKVFGCDKHSTTNNTGGCCKH